MNDQDKKFAKLNMLDDYGHRLFIIPAEVRGKWKTYKSYVHTFLLLVFLLLPWISLDGHQVLLLDIANRQFYFFGLKLLSHDAPLLFLILLGLAVGLALVTALWGRVWCGWACPQTVFIERVFRQIEIWVEGNYLERRKLQHASMSFSKFKRLSLKWILYFLVSSIMAHSFLSYFIGSEKLIQMMSLSPFQNWTYFLLVSSCTALFLFNFGWFREQFCIIVCPYGKIQSVLMDQQSLAVTYDSSRFDCVQCNRCVQVCPTGIDIRKGLQMECINCTACIDACDEIMEKVSKPKGLIRYKALTHQTINWFRPRVLVYSTFLIFSLGGLIWGLGTHADFSVHIKRSQGLPFLNLNYDGEQVIQNQFLLRIQNHSKGEKNISLKILTENINLRLSQNPVIIPSGAHQSIPFFLHQSANRFTSAGIQDVIVEIKTDDEVWTEVIQMLGPQQEL